MKKIIALFLALVALPISSYAQASLAYEIFSAKATKFSKLTTTFVSNSYPMVAANAPVFASAAAGASGAVISTAGQLAVGASKVAVVVNGAATGAVILQAVKTLALGGTGGVVGVGLAALTVVPLLVDYFKSDTSRVGPANMQGTNTPFEKGLGTSTIAREYYTVGFSYPAGPTPAAACDNTAKARGGALFYGVINSNGTWCVLYRYSNGGNEGEFTISRRDVTQTTYTWSPASWDDVTPALIATDRVIPPAQMAAILDAGAQIEFKPTTVTGPASVTSPATTSTVETPDKKTVTVSTPSSTIEYSAPLDASGNVSPTVKVSPIVTTTSTVTDKATGVATVASTTVTNQPKPAPPEAPQTCGLPGTPKCAMDEAGTAVYDQKKLDLDKATLDSASSAQRTTIKGDGDKTMFTSFAKFFTLPALRACEPVAMPQYGGVQMASMNICPGAEWLRGLMGFVWAIAGFAFCFKTVEGVI